MRAAILGFSHVACPTCRHWDMPQAQWCGKRKQAPPIYNDSYRCCREYDPNPNWLETRGLKPPK